MAANSWLSIHNINNWRLWIWKNEASLKLIKKQVDNYIFIDKIYLYVKDSNEAKYQYLKNKWENPGLKCFHDSKAFNDYSTDMDNIYKNIEEYNPSKSHKILIVFDMITGMLSIKRLNLIITKLLIRGKKLNILVAYTMLLHNPILLY